MKGRKIDGEIGMLLRIIEEGFHSKSWHGPNLRGSLRGLTQEEAAWRPARGCHNIWEIAVHCAYWKYIVRRRLLGEKRGSFSLKGSNWIVRPAVLTLAAWKSDLRLLEDCHRSLCEAVAALDQRTLGTTPKGSAVGNRAIITGIAAHDVYHAGQIQLLKRMMRESR